MPTTTTTITDKRVTGNSTAVSCADKSRRNKAVFELKVFFVLFELFYQILLQSEYYQTRTARLSLRVGSFVFNYFFPQKSCYSC